MTDVPPRPGPAQDQGERHPRGQDHAVGEQDGAGVVGHRNEIGDPPRNRVGFGCRIGAEGRPVPRTDAIHVVGPGPGDLVPRARLGLKPPAGRIVLGPPAGRGRIVGRAGLMGVHAPILPSRLPASGSPRAAPPARVSKGRRPCPDGGRPHDLTRGRDRSPASLPGRRPGSWCPVHTGRRRQTTASERRPASPSGPGTSHHRS